MFECRAGHMNVCELFLRILYCAREAVRSVGSSQAPVEHGGTVPGIHEARMSPCGSDIGKKRMPRSVQEATFGFDLLRFVTEAGLNLSMSKAGV